MRMALSEIALWTNGVLLGADGEVSGAAVDSRQLSQGELFVALPGEHVDGHDFLAQAHARGAGGALVSRPSAVDLLSQIQVADTELALGDLASAARARMHARVVGITGSSGKTTVKNMLAAIFATCGPTHASSGNHNNEIGLPLSVLATPADTEYAVFEMGAGKPGDIAYLAAIARPAVGIITNIAPAHVARLGSVEGVAETKAALYEALPADGVAVVPADDAFTTYFLRVAGNRQVLRFGLEKGADVSAEDLHCAIGGSEFTLVSGMDRIDVRLALPGRHQVMNALAAAAAAIALEVPLDRIRTGLAALAPAAGRGLRLETPGGWVLIDDSYNANPSSLAAATNLLAMAGGERWLVMGDMAELGDEEDARHAEAGSQARAAGLDRLFASGSLGRHAVEAFGAGGEHCEGNQALLVSLRRQLHPGVTCLIKGSRSARMEEVVQGLIDAAASGGHGNAA